MKRLSSKPKHNESFREEISYAPSLVSMAKASYFPPSKLNSVCESALLVPQVKLRLDDKSDRCGHVSNCHFGSNLSFRTLGSPPINTLPLQSFVGLLDWSLPEYSLRESELWASQERHRNKTKSLPPKHKSYWSELIWNDLGGNLLAFLSRRLESQSSESKE